MLFSTVVIASLVSMIAGQGGAPSPGGQGSPNTGGQGASGSGAGASAAAVGGAASSTTNIQPFTGIPTGFKFNIQVLKEALLPESPTLAKLARLSRSTARLLPLLSRRYLDFSSRANVLV
jgi:hypothetical protein